MTAISKHTNIKILSLADIPLNSECVISLIPVLRQNVLSEHLNLSNCDLKGKDGERVLDALLSNGSAKIKWLKLMDNPLTSEAINKVARLISV